LTTAAFRNLADREVALQGKDIFLVGENGQGKTNFLEALYFCAYGSSFRGVRDAEMVREGAASKSFSVRAVLGDSVNAEVQVSLREGKKSIQIDGKKAEDRRALLSVIPCVVFCHEDMEFVSGPPERRRWFFDQSQSLYDPLYLEDLRRYRRVLSARNTVLREARLFYKKMSRGEVERTLDALDPQLVRYGLELMVKREEAAARFSRVFGPLYEGVAGIAGIGVRYVPSWKFFSPLPLEKQLAEKREGDLAAGVSLSGPHRDRYVFFQAAPGEEGGKEFSGRASTGQRRLLALSLRVAQARCYSEMTGRNPVLLLDDVLLELDGEKRRRFFPLIPGYDQAFYTFLPEEPYHAYRKSDTLVYRVSGGGFLAD